MVTPLRGCHWACAGGIRVMQAGTANSSFFHPRETLREAALMDVVAMALGTWQPCNDPACDESLERLALKGWMLDDVAGARPWDARIAGLMQAVSTKAVVHRPLKHGVTGQ